MERQQVLIVGGFVRDLLLGRQPKDLDFVVVGMTEDEFLRDYPDARKGGRSFPVFKVGGEDYAFARTEKSTGLGYNDFDPEFHPDVSLEEDLSRRDLTINAIAMCPETGHLVSVNGGLEDLENKILRHVSDAFTEDPLRVFRLARFAAKFPEFTIAPETIEIARSMKDLLPHLSAERVWEETASALGARKPSLYFEALRKVDALSYWFEELQLLIGVPAGPLEYHPEEDTFIHAMEVLDKAAELTHDRAARWAALCHDLGKGNTEKELLPRHKLHDKRGIEPAFNLGKRLRASTRFIKAASLACKEHMRVHGLHEMRPGKAVKVLQEISRFPGGLSEFMNVITADGMKPEVGEFILAVYEPIMSIRLPKEYHGRGAASGMILLGLRAHEWKRQKNILL